MALLNRPLTDAEIREALDAPKSPLPSFLDLMLNAERRYVAEGVRRALCLWASELEPELMFRHGQTRPFGITAKGHGTPYIEIRWDDHFYLDGDPIRYQVRHVIGAQHGVQTPKMSAKHDTA